jgi:hypothetical protein
VRDRVINEESSLLVRDARLDQAFAEHMSIVQQQIPPSSAARLGHLEPPELGGCISR